MGPAAGPLGLLPLAIAAAALILAGAGAESRAAEDAARSAAAETDERDEREPVAVPEPSETAMRFYRGNNVLWAVNQAWALLLTGGLAFSGLSARLRSLSGRLADRVRSLLPPRRRGGPASPDIDEKCPEFGPVTSKPPPARLEGNGFWTIGIYVVLYLVLVFAINLPLSFYQGFIRLHAYDLSNQTLGKWFHDATIRLAVAAVVGFVLTWVPYGLMARSPRRWWLYMTLLYVPFLYATMLVTPVWIDPLFNRFGPMKDKGLERRILDLAERAGIEGSRVFEVEKSVDTRAVNAYVTGVFGTKRIVLWDTLLTKLDPPEVLTVMGHEMGHYVLGHVVRSIWLGSLVILVGLFFVDRAGQWLIARFRGRLGFDRLSDVASVPLVLMLMEVSSLFLGPVTLAYSRYQEHEADCFTLDLTHANHSAAMADVKMQAENLGNPRPGLFYKIFRASHPSIGERIDFANAYHPWWDRAAPQPSADADRADGAAKSERSDPVDHSSPER
jgi:Zn-dependent protease with chaperone function